MEGQRPIDGRPHRLKKRNGKKESRERGGKERERERGMKRKRREGERKWRKGREKRDGEKEKEKMRNSKFGTGKFPRESGSGASTPGTAVGTAACQWPPPRSRISHPLNRTKDH